MRDRGLGARTGVQLAPPESRRNPVIEGVSKVVIEVDDQARALGFWTERLGFELHQDTPYGEERWVEVSTPDRGLILVLSPRQDAGPSGHDMLPTSNVFFFCDDLTATYDELRSRGVEFPQPPVELSFGWWSMFQDQEGNRFALHPRERGQQGR
jgi:predicted enzyme related to lactoylglutathione lyase